MSDPWIVGAGNLATTFRFRINLRKSLFDAQREVNFVQYVFHDEAAIAQIYSACLPLPVPVLPAISFSPTFYLGALN